jgi:ABC-2 type transport system ATP-binding protein
MATVVGWPPIMEHVIVARSLCKRYLTATALRNVDFAASASQVVGVIGPNGAGKTTLLYLLGGAILPSSGKVTVFGMDRWKQNYDIRLRSIVLPAWPEFGTTQTPYAYLRFIAQIYGMPKDLFLERVKRLADEMDFTAHLGRRFAGLSTGLVKKAGIIGCFLPDVQLRILDEPFAGGIDPGGMETLYGWFAQGRSRGETIIFATQVLDQAEIVADRLLLLDEGTERAFGTPEELISQAGIDPDSPRSLAKAFMSLTRDR